MTDSDNADMIIDEVPGSDIVEDVLNAIENAKQMFNLIRSQRLLSEAVYEGGLPTAKSSLEENDSDTEECIMVLEDQIDRFCIQEDALQFSLENDTVGKITSSEATSSELQELLEIHNKQQAEIKSMASNLFEECPKLQEGQSNLTQKLKEYITYENRQSQQFKENSGSENRQATQKLRKRLKEIRFMQLVIPRIISQSNTDLLETQWLKGLCQEVRKPILSLEDIQ